MTTQAISMEEKSQLIFNHKNTLDKYWNMYSMELITQITATERLYHHQIMPSEKGHLTVNIFGGANINIIRSNIFSALQINFVIESPELNAIALPTSSIDADGYLDRTIPLHDKTQVFAHYLERLQAVYDAILALSQKRA